LIRPDLRGPLGAESGNGVRLLLLLLLPSGSGVRPAGMTFMVLVGVGDGEGAILDGAGGAVHTDGSGLGSCFGAGEALEDDFWVDDDRFDEDFARGAALGALAGARFFGGCFNMNEAIMRLASPIFNLMILRGRSLISKLDGVSSSRGFLGGRVASSSRGLLGGFIVSSSLRGFFGGLIKSSSARGLLGGLMGSVALLGSVILLGLGGG